MEIVGHIFVFSLNVIRIKAYCHNNNYFEWSSFQGHSSVFVPSLMKSLVMRFHFPYLFH